MISRVLVPIDGSPESEQAIPYARRLLSDGGTILLLTVVPKLADSAANDAALTELHWALQLAQDAVQLADIDAAREYGNRIVERDSDNPQQWTVQACQGDPATEILRAIEQQEVDLVAMTTHGRGSVGRVVFGSVADRVARTSPVPVLLIRPAPGVALPDDERIRRVLLPMDGSELAEDALPLAAAVARGRSIPIHLVRAINSAAVMASMSGGSFFPVTPPQDVFHQMVNDLEAQARDYLTRIAARLQDEGIEVTWTVVDGSPYFEITSAVQPGDLVVMTSHGRGGVMRWMLGSVAEKVVREAPAPVLLVPASHRQSDEQDEIT